MSSGVEETWREGNAPPPYILNEAVGQVGDRHGAEWSNSWHRLVENVGRGAVRMDAGTAPHVDQVEFPPPPYILNEAVPKS